MNKLFLSLFLAATLADQTLQLKLESCRILRETLIEDYRQHRSVERVKEELNQFLNSCKKTDEWDLEYYEDESEVVMKYN